MIRLVGATVNQILTISSGLCLLGGRIGLIGLRRCVSCGSRSLVGGILSGLRSRIGLDGGVRGVGSGLIRHGHPQIAIPPFRRVRAIRGVNPQGRSLAHRSIRRRALDEHVGLAVSHASCGSGSGIGLLRGIGRIGGGLSRTIGGGLGLSRHARRIGSGGLGVGRVRLGRSRVGLGGLGGLIGGVSQRLRIACGLLRALGSGLSGIGRVLCLTGSRGSTLRSSLSRIGGILSRLGRAIRRVGGALSRLRGGSGILSSLLRIGGLRGVIRDVGLRLSDFVRVLLHVGIAQVVPRGAIPDKRLNHAIRQRHERGRRIIGFALPVGVEVGQEARAVVFLAFPPRPIFLRLEPQVADDQIVLRLVRPTESVIL